MSILTALGALLKGAPEFSKDHAARSEQLRDRLASITAEEAAQLHELANQRRAATAAAAKARAEAEAEAEAIRQRAADDLVTEHDRRLGPLVAEFITQPSRKVTREICEAFRELDERCRREQGREINFRLLGTLFAERVSERWPSAMNKFGGEGLGEDGLACLGAFVESLDAPERAQVALEALEAALLKLARIAARQELCERSARRFRATRKATYPDEVKALQAFDEAEAAQERRRASQMVITLPRVGSMSAREIEEMKRRSRRNRSAALAEPVAEPTEEPPEAS